MSSIQSLTSGELLKLQKVVNITAVTTVGALVIQSCGPLAYYKVTVAAGGDVTLGGDNVDGTTTLYTIDLSTPAAGFDTFGELEAYINNSTAGHFRCYLVGVRPETITDNNLITLAATHLKTGATAAVYANGLTLYGDPAVTPFAIGFSVTNQKFISQPIGGFSTQQAGWIKDTRCINTLRYLSFLATATGGGTINLYTCDDVNHVSTLMYSGAFVSATVLIPNANPSIDFWQANLGHRLLMYGLGAAAVSVPTIVGTGFTKQVDGDVVQGGNYAGCA